MVQVKVLGVFTMIDEGETDWKVIAIDVNDPLAANLNDIQDVDKIMLGFLKATVEWFKIYKMDDTLKYIMFWILQYCYKMFNIILRFISNRCFMYGKVDSGNARGLKVRILGRSKFKEATVIQELFSLDNFLFYFDSLIEDTET